MIDRVARAAFALVLVVSLVILFAPSSAVPTGPPGVDKVVHFTIFAALAFTAVGARVPRQLVLALGLGYAALSEILQFTLPGLNRDGSVGDWAADTLGVVAGLLASGVLVEAWRGPRRR